jgi:hypothetical protein
MTVSYRSGMIYVPIERWGGFPALIKSKNQWPAPPSEEQETSSHGDLVKRRHM